VVQPEELQDRLWPQDTFVEYRERSQQRHQPPREALGDTAESRAIYRNRPRHGYRSSPRFRRRLPSSRAAISVQVVSLWDHSGGGLGGWRCISLCPEPQTGDPFSCRFAFPEFEDRKADDYFAGGMTDAVTTDLPNSAYPK